MEAVKAWATRWVVTVPGSLFEWGGTKGLDILLRLGELLLLAAAFIWIGAKKPNELLLYVGAAILAAGSAWVALLLTDLVCQLRPNWRHFRLQTLVVVGVAMLVASLTVFFPSLLDLANAQFGE